MGQQVHSINYCQTFLFIVYVVVFGTMLVFGLIGNTLSFMVLQWEKHNYVATFLLQVMALADNLFLLTTGYTQIYAALVYFLDQTTHFLGAYNMKYVAAGTHNSARPRLDHGAHSLQPLHRHL